MNKYGKIENGVFVAYPFKYDNETKRRVNPTAEELEDGGWKKVLDAGIDFVDPESRKNKILVAKYVELGNYIVRESEWVEK